MLTLESLNDCFKSAVANNYKYVAVRISIGLTKEEVIINPRENFEEKLSYYNTAYDESLRHKFAGGENIRITGFIYGNSFYELEEVLNIYDATGYLN
ncbi:hypothetical protein RVS70_05785 [Virgibacillus sp. M23]|uniref:hypothetical protein n=1 Tax=Virgibacillus sp. M23 TaxID=3079030 RepID=UPI002A90BE52|nr:hypothetical protein [Virgibacillus sp. M23]MDY7043712.1 hypothetical protein [Virgibacillus sp. M23]